MILILSLSFTYGRNLSTYPRTGRKVLRTTPRSQQDSLLWFNIMPVCLCQWITSLFFSTPAALMTGKPSRLQIPTPWISKQIHVPGSAQLLCFGYWDLFEGKEKARPHFVFLPSWISPCLGTALPQPFELCITLKNHRKAPKAPFPFPQPLLGARARSAGHWGHR